jgi:death-on-curing protein
VTLQFLELEDVLELHKAQLEMFGGSDGVRDMGLLQSALAQPQAGFGGQYFHGDLYEMAAAYLYSLVQNHPFVDANKRTGTDAAVTFLAINGVTLDVDMGSFKEIVLGVAQGETAKSKVAEFFRQHGRRDS